MTAKKEKKILPQKKFSFFISNEGMAGSEYAIVAETKEQAIALMEQLYPGAVILFLREYIEE